MKNSGKTITEIIVVLLIIIAIAIGAWLGLYVMLWGGIQQILNKSSVVSGVIKIAFCSVGFVPMYFILRFAKKLLESKHQTELKDAEDEE